MDFQLSATSPSLIGYVPSEVSLHWVDYAHDGKEPPPPHIRLYVGKRSFVGRVRQGG